MLAPGITRGGREREGELEEKEKEKEKGAVVVVGRICGDVRGGDTCAG